MKIEFHINRNKLDLGDPKIDVKKGYYWIELLVDAFCSDTDNNVFQVSEGKSIPIGYISSNTDEIKANYDYYRLYILLIPNKVKFDNNDDWKMLFYDTVKDEFRQSVYTGYDIGKVLSIDCSNVKREHKATKKEKEIEYFLRDETYKERIKMNIYSKFTVGKFNNN